MNEEELTKKIATLQKEKNYYLDLAKKTESTLEQAKTLAFSCQEKIAVLNEFLPKKQETTEKNNA